MATGRPGARAMAVPHTGLLWSTTVPRRGAEAASSWLSLELELERVVSLQGAALTAVCARGSWQPV